jgi:hypothetical protein
VARVRRNRIELNRDCAAGFCLVAFPSRESVSTPDQVRGMLRKNAPGAQNPRAFQIQGHFNSGVFQIQAFFEFLKKLCLA